MFHSQTVSPSRLPHLATVAALMLTLAVGVMQSGTRADTVTASTASVTTR